MQTETSITLQARVTCLIAEGTLPVTVALNITHWDLSINRIIQIARAAHCSVSYLIDIRQKEPDMDVEYVFSDEPQLMRFRRRLLQAMEMSDVKTAYDLARISGVSHKCVMSYMRGTRLPSAISLVKLSRSLAVSCDWLLGFDKKGEKPWKLVLFMGTTKDK